MEKYWLLSDTVQSLVGVRMLICSGATPILVKSSVSLSAGTTVVMASTDKKILSHCKKCKKVNVEQYYHIISNLDLRGAQLLLDGGITDGYMRIPETIETPKVPYDKTLGSNIVSQVAQSVKKFHKLNS